MRHTVLILTLFAALGLSGCNMMEGLGKDIQKAGERIEGHAEKHTD
ncbi:MAG: entericidin A/B family lipoprotein [Gammaproteobacteria bacterium]|nr:MAG: entericidin A/B family lipoprotein [Gammaproteobacteria bacterium]